MLLPYAVVLLISMFLLCLVLYSIISGNSNRSNVDISIRIFICVVLTCLFFGEIIVDVGASKISKLTYDTNREVFVKDSIVFVKLDDLDFTEDDRITQPVNLNVLFGRNLSDVKSVEVSVLEPNVVKCFGLISIYGISYNEVVLTIDGQSVKVPYKYYE